MSKPRKHKHPGAKPVIATTYGYTRGGMDIKQVKIATSNLFQDTATPEIDYLSGISFESISAMEFANSGDADTVLQQGKSLISNGSSIIELATSVITSKQAYGTNAIEKEFPILLRHYLPLTTTRTIFLGVAYWGDPLATTTVDKASYPEINYYFDDTYANIYIELEDMADDEEVEVEFILSTNFSSGII